MYIRDRQRMIDALMPSVDSAVDELACTRNEKGHPSLIHISEPTRPY